MRVDMGTVGKREWGFERRALDARAPGQSSYNDVGTTGATGPDAAEFGGRPAIGWEPWLPAAEPDPPRWPPTGAARRGHRHEAHRTPRSPHRSGRSRRQGRSRHGFAAGRRGPFLIAIPGAAAGQLPAPVDSALHRIFASRTYAADRFGPARYPDVYTLGVAVAPVADQRLNDTIYQERYMGVPEENPEGYRTGSPINFADGLKGKLPIVHGTGDDNVHYQGTARLIDRLVALDTQFDLMIYPNRTHRICEGAGTTLQLYSTLTRYLLTNMPPER